MESISAIFYSDVKVNKVIWYSLTVLALVFSFLPLYTAPNAVIRKENYNESLKNETYAHVIVVLIAMSVPMVYDSFLDYVHASTIICLELFRLLLSLSLLIPCIIIQQLCLSPPNPDLFVSIAIFHNTLLFCSIFLILNLLDNSVWTDARITVIMIFEFVIWTTFTCGVAIAPRILLITELVFICSVIFCLVILWTAYKRYRAIINDGAVIGFHNLSDNQLVSIFYIMALIIMVAYQQFGAFALNGTANNLYTLYVRAGLIVLLTLYPGRIARRRADSSKVCLYMS